MENILHANKALRKKLEEYEKLAAAGKLAAGVAHSIRNPLTSIKMRLFSLKRLQDIPSARREDLDVISEEIASVEYIIRSFLDFSRRPKPKMEKTSPSDIVDMAVQWFKPQASSNRVSVKIHRSKRLPETWIDSVQLKEALLNLLGNANEAFEHGGGSIIIQEDEGIFHSLGRVMCIRINDDGPGIPEVIQEKLFQPFFTTKENGTGLGLSIAKRILDEHGGKLEFSSEVGKGTVFTITLPYHDHIPSPL